MSTVFLGGSRHVTSLPGFGTDRLKNMIRQQHAVIVGDAGGADSAIQSFFRAESYSNVTVFCSGDKPRNNLGNWPVRRVEASGQKGFQFFAAKDRAMAAHSDFGLMFWDGRSPGTVLNVLRILRAGNIAVLLHVPEQRTVNFRTLSDWESFLHSAGQGLRAALEKRATPDEWLSCPPSSQQPFLGAA